MASSTSSALIDAMFWAVILAFAVAVYDRFFPPDETTTKTPGDAGILTSPEACACAAYPKLGALLGGFRHSSILAMAYLSRLGSTVAGFVYGRLLQGLLIPLVSHLFSFAGGVASFLTYLWCFLFSLYGLFLSLVRGFLIPGMCSLLSFGSGVSGFMYGSVLRGFLIPVMCSLLSFASGVAGFVYGSVVCGFLIPVVRFLLGLGGAAVGLAYGSLIRGFLIPITCSLLSFMYVDLLRGVLIPAVCCLLSFGADVIRFVSAHLLPCVLTHVSCFLFGDD